MSFVVSQPEPALLEASDLKQTEPTKGPQKQLVHHLWIVPPLVVMWMILTFGVNVPVFDQFNFLHTLQKSEETGLGFRDLFVQHNEHRILFPRLLAFRWPS
jgi:hypothetical protein